MSLSSLSNITSYSLGVGIYFASSGFVQYTFLFTSSSSAIYYSLSLSTKASGLRYANLRSILLTASTSCELPLFSRVWNSFKAFSVLSSLSKLLSSFLVVLPCLSSFLSYFSHSPHIWFFSCFIVCSSLLIISFWFMLVRSAALSECFWSEKTAKILCLLSISETSENDCILFSLLHPSFAPLAC